MKEKKKVADWNVAATLWLTAGFTALFFNLFLAFVISSVATEESTAVIMRPVWFLSCWLGIMESTHYVAKTYTGYNIDRVQMLAATYLAIVGLSFRGIVPIFLGMGIDLVDVAIFVTIVVFFYFVTGIYLRKETGKQTAR